MSNCLADAPSYNWPRMPYIWVLLALTLVLQIAPAVSDENIPDVVNRVAEQLIPGLEPDRVHSTPIPDLYLAAFGVQLVYISADGHYLLTGDLIELDSSRNLAEEVRNEVRREAIDMLDESGMVVFLPEQERSNITVFTDITCPYCSKLHQEIGVLSNGGVKVRYLAYPRAGIPSEAHDILVSVWCADDPQQAMTDAKSGRQIEQKNCDTQFRAHMAVAERVGVRGTPTILLQNGRILPGYVPAEELVQLANVAAGTGD
jgi:thiol:disulfide interchange protein DsbC